MTDTGPDTSDVTAPFREAVERAEGLIRNAPFIRSQADLDEGLDYLAGRIRASLQLAFDHDLARPLFINSTHQFSRQGLDNPDAIYFHCYLTSDAEYVVRGRRGTTADLSFQVMADGYSASGAPESLMAFDARDLEIAEDGTFEFSIGPLAGAKTLIVREVFNDWDTEERGTIWIERTDMVGVPAPAKPYSRIARQYDVAGKLLTGSVETWLAFPHFYQWKEPVNTLTSPASTPGGLTSQMSSIGHYELGDDEAMVVSVPESEDCAYQAIQIGSDWYASTDYETHQTSLTKAQALTDPDGVMRFVISQQDPGLANWLETLGHRTGPIMLRWQQLAPGVTPEGPTVEIVPFDELSKVLPFHSPITPDEYAVRIAARQRSIARRMLS